MFGTGEKEELSALHIRKSNQKDIKVVMPLNNTKDIPR